jgi:tetratricopeptide (TPR) repeat protein
MRARSFEFLRNASVVVLAAMTVAAPATAGVGDGMEPKQPTSLLGSYLAGRMARGLNDPSAAATYYGEALRRDPDNQLLIENALLMEASEGNWPRVEPLARDLVKAQPTHRTARTFVALAAFKAGRYAEAASHFSEASAHPIGELTSTLARAWLALAQNNAQEALNVLDTQKLPDWASYFLRYHRALIADISGRPAEARAAYERMTKNDQRTLRITLAFARHAARAGDTRLAQNVLNAYFERTKGEPHPSARALMDQIEAGERPELLVRSADEGLAEVFFGLGEALSGEGNLGIGVVLLQYALYLTPDSMFPLVTLASAQENSKRYAAANAAYDRIPKGTPLDMIIDVRKALNLNQLERVQEAKELLDNLASQYPADVRPLEALGAMMRGHKRYAEAVQYYSRAISLIDAPEAKHWTFYYSRGTCYERLKKLPEAEADLRMSLKLSPDQPLTLNYLGYTWVDHNRNLRQGMAMIEKAVRLKPDDGYIVDSLGWAYYRLGKFKQALRHLERAVELRPDDPTLNDHLGDVYWRVGRVREARFQWEQALTLQPEAAEAEKMRHKLEHGLPTGPQARKPKRPKQVQKQERAKPRTAKPSTPFFQ